MTVLWWVWYLGYLSTPATQEELIIVSRVEWGRLTVRLLFCRVCSPEYLFVITSISPGRPDSAP